MNQPKLRVSYLMAARLGLEPRQTESESVVLPLHNRAKLFLGLYSLHRQLVDLAMQLLDEVFLADAAVIVDLDIH